MVFILKFVYSVQSKCVMSDRLNSSLRSSALNRQIEQDSEYYTIHQLPSPDPRNRLTFTALLESERETYEIVSDIVPNTQTPQIPLPESSGFDRPMNPERRIDLCHRCQRPIGNKPFCYKCFGPSTKKTESSSKFYVWLSLSLFLGILIVICLGMCMTHKFKVELYEERNKAKLQKDIRVTILEVKYLINFLDGFLRAEKPNDSLMSLNFDNIRKVLEAGCKEYIRISFVTEIGIMCEQMKNGTFFIQKKLL